MSFAHQSRPDGGVTDHGLLTGLADDDHTQYALAAKTRPSPWVAAGDLTARSLADLGTRAHDLLTGLADDDHSQYALAAKTRPSPWVAAGDLTARSLADLGTRAHDLLTGLGDDDHTQYALLAGRSGGQALRGGLLTTEPLTLLDGLGTQRLQVLDTSPHITLGDGANDDTGDTVIMGRAAIGNSWPTLKTYSQVYIAREPPTGRGCGLNIGVGFSPPDPGNYYLWGLSGIASWTGYGNGTLCAGLNFEAYATMYDGTLASLEGVRVRLYSNLSNPAAITNGRGLHVLRPLSGGLGTRLSNVAGLYIEDQYSAIGSTTPTYVRGFKCDDLSGGTNRYLLELGPTVPYVLVVGGADAPAGLTNLWLKVASEATNPLQVGVGAADSGGTGYRCLRVLN